MTRFTVIGDGAMGTACALLLAQKSDQEVALWCQFEENRRLMAEKRENIRFLPGVKIPPTIRLESDWGACRDSAAYIVAVPTVYLAKTLERLHADCPAEVPAVSVAKGLEQGTFRSPTQIIRQVLGPRGVAALSGPSHAEEIARGMPASVVVASGDLRLARQVQHWFNSDRFRVYTTHDLLGVELAAALKNVIAIAAGICDGLGLGDNAKSALMTRGLVEMIRFGKSLGAEAETFHGLAGLGDLITTCISPHGRNRRVGEQLGRGKTLDDILKEMNQVAEGVWTCRSVHELALQRQLDLPVIAEVYSILFEKKDVRAAVADLMARDPKPERN